VNDRHFAIAAVQLIEKKGETNFATLRAAEAFCKHLDMINYPMDRFCRLAERISQLIIFMFHISIPGAIRISHAVKLKLFNEIPNAAENVDALRNVFILKGQIVMLHSLDKAGSAKGVEFDPNAPTISIPHPATGARLLLYFVYILPLYLMEKHKLLSKAQLEQSIFAKEELWLHIKAQHPFVPLTWSPNDGPVTISDFLKRAEGAYNRAFREMSLRCKENKFYMHLITSYR
jgi:hypothetical protein